VPGADLPATTQDASATTTDAERPKKRVVYEVKKKKKVQQPTTERQESDPATATGNNCNLLLFVNILHQNIVGHQSRSIWSILGSLPG